MDPDEMLEGDRKLLEVSQDTLGGLCSMKQKAWIAEVLDNDKFGPGNRPHWEMKEGRAPPRYPDLIKTLKRETDPSQRRQILAGHMTRIFGPSRGTVSTGVISQ